MYFLASGSISLCLFTKKNSCNTISIIFLKNSKPPPEFFIYSKYDLLLFLIDSFFNMRLCLFDVPNLPKYNYDGILLIKPGQSRNKYYYSESKIININM